VEKAFCHLKSKFEEYFCRRVVIIFYVNDTISTLFKKVSPLPI
jgi:hypothetical protein